MIARLLKGLPKVYLEERLCQLQEEEEWSAVMDVFGLLLYRILMFPQVENYIDLAAIEVFMAKMDRGENPTMAILANTYYTLNYCNEQKGGSLRCCTPLLYLWLTAHLFQCKTKTVCPMTIRWYPPWNEREHMIIKCGGYPNGTINYNSKLASQQVGYPMIRASQEETMTPFVLYWLEAYKGTHQRKIRHTWNNIVRKGMAWRARSCGASPSYRAWLENRVKLVGLPWGRTQHHDQEAQGYEVQETLKIGELESAIEQMKAEQRDIKRKLETAVEEVYRERQLKDETTKRA
ncbi:hypothetical protein CR513_14505, partial [Mucuna pruriens]